MMHDALFYLLAAFMLAMATATVTLRNLFHAALALLGTLFGSAASGCFNTAVRAVPVYSG